MNDLLSKKRISIIKEFSGINNKILDIGDINNSSLNKALKEKNKVTTIDFRKGSDIKANLENGLKIKSKYDLVIAGEVFEHIYHLRNLLKDIKKVLNKKGRLIVSIPNVCNLKSRLKVLLGKLPTYCADADDIDKKMGGHIRDFNLTKIKNILTESGFVIKKIKTNGLAYKNKILIPEMICPISFGDNIIILAETK